MSKRQEHRLWIATLAGVLISAIAAAQMSAKVPLCPGLTIVTAISEPQGDYESLKTVTAVDGSSVQLRISAELPPEQVGGGLHVM